MTPDTNSLSPLSPPSPTQIWKFAILVLFLENQLLVTLVFIIELSFFLLC